MWTHNATDPRLGESVGVCMERMVLNSIVLPHKELATCSKNQIIRPVTLLALCKHTRIISCITISEVLYLQYLRIPVCVVVWKDQTCHMWLIRAWGWSRELEYSVTNLVPGHQSHVNLETGCIGYNGDSVQVCNRLLTDNPYC